MLESKLSINIVKLSQLQKRLVRVFSLYLFIILCTKMAMIGVPLMNSGINPYKQMKPNVRNTPSDAPKLSDSPQRSRRRYQSEMIVDNQAIKSARKRYQSENQQLTAEMNQIMLKQKSNK